MTRHYAESNINILLTRNFPIDCSVTQSSQFLMIPLHCLWAKSNNRTRGQFECDVTWFCFCFDFVHSHARCGLKFYVQTQGGILDVDGQGVRDL